MVFSLVFEEWRPSLLDTNGIRSGRGAEKKIAPIAPMESKCVSDDDDEVGPAIATPGPPPNEKATASPAVPSFVDKALEGRLAERVQASF